MSPPHVDIPLALGEEDRAWRTVLELAAADLPRWVLAGGLMVQVHLHGAGAQPLRATTDVDVIVDLQVSADRPLELFAACLTAGLGMRVEASGDGTRGHRFVRDDGAQVDVLAPDRAGPRARLETIPPLTTVAAPGGRVLLRDAVRVELVYDGESGVVLCPPPLPAAIAKWRAFAEIPVQDDRDRHLRDAVALLVVADPAGVELSRKDRRRLAALKVELDRRRDGGGLAVDERLLAEALAGIALLLGE